MIQIWQISCSIQLHLWITCHDTFGFLFSFSPVGSAPTFANVYDILIQDLHFYWYEIFVCLGISRERLKEIEAKYPFEAHMCLFEAVKLWINREDPPPKWQDLVNVLRYKILENKAAQRIEKLYLIDPEEELRGM